MIREITIRGFKSLRDVTVSLEPLTVLVGRSGTGKSNFVGAIRFLRDFLRSGTPWNYEYKPEVIAPAGRQKFFLHIRLKFEIAGIDDLFHYSVAIGHQEKGSEESLVLGDTTLFHHRDGRWLTPPNVAPEPQVQMPMLGRLPAVTEAVIAYSALTDGTGCYEFPVGVLTQSANSKKPSVGLDDEALNYLPVMRSIYSNLRDLHLRRTILANLTTLNRTVVAVELDSITSPQRALVTHQFNGDRLVFPLAQESEGFRRVLAHLLAIYQEPPKQTLVFEEPENGIYPGALELLASELKSAHESGRGQVILTTHSPGLLDHFEIETVRVVELKGGETTIGPVADYQMQSVREGLLQTGELLTVDEARTQATETAEP